MKKPILESGRGRHAAGRHRFGAAVRLRHRQIRQRILDHSNIKRFMAAGLAVSAVANLLVGLLGFANGGGIVGNMVLFVAFAVMWGVSGWSQSWALPRPSSPSRGSARSASGHLLQFFSASHNLGEFLSFLFVGAVVGVASAGNGDS